jgi:ribonucleotide reductase alpha subunit
MLKAQKEKLEKVVELVEKVSINPDITVDYFIPGVLVTEGADGSGEAGGPYVQFTYTVNGSDPHVQHMPLTHGYLEKDPEDLTNLITFSLERFMEEIDSRQYGAQ